MEIRERTTASPVSDHDRGRLPVPPSVLVPVAALVVAVALGAVGRLIGPATANQSSATNSARESPGSQESISAPAFANEVAGLRVLSVGEALEQVRVQPRGTLIPVRGWVTAPRESTACEVIPGRGEPTWTLLCWRGAILSADRDPLLAVDGTPLRLGDPAPQLSSDVMPGTSIAPSLVEADGERRVLRPTPVIVLGRAVDRAAWSCDEGASCARSFAIERVLEPDGSTADRVTRRDPALGFSTLPRADLLATLGPVVPGSPVELREVFVDRSNLAYLDPTAAATAPQATGSGIWYVSAIVDGSEPSSRVSWLVVDDATGAVLASGSG